MKKILVMRYRFIGDTILTIPFLRNLRYKYPNAQIDMLVSTGSGEVIEDCPYVNNFIYFDTTKKFKYENGMKKSFWNYANCLRKEKYDKVYVLKRSFSSAFLAFLTGAKERIGFNTEHRGFLLTKKVPYVENKHEIECFLDVLRADKIEPKDNYLECFIDDTSLTKVKKVFEDFGINESKKRVIIHATASNKYKEWSSENWAKIIEYVINEKNAQVIFLGAQKDISAYREILSKIKEELTIKPLNLCGKLSLKESLAAIKQSDLIVGIDSGNLHMAAAAKTRVIGLYGPMNENKWGAYPCKSGYNTILTANIDCHPCGLKGKKKNKCNHDCMNKITVEQVKNAIDKII